MADPNCLIDNRDQYVFDYKRAVIWDQAISSSRAILIMDRLPNTHVVMISAFDDGSPSETWFVGSRDDIATREGFHGPFDIREAMIVHLLLLLEHK